MNMTTFTSLKKRFRVVLPITLMLSLGATAHAAAPDANNDSFTSSGERIDADETKVILAPLLLVNDSGDDIVFDSISGSSSSDGASISYSSGSQLITYDPSGVSVFINLPQGSTRNDTFTYSISGSDGPNDSATVTIRVVGINDAPSFGVLPSSPIAMDDDTPIKPFALTTVNDPDTGEILSITLDVNNADHNENKGSFAQSSGYSGSRSFSGPNGSGVYTLTNATVAQAQQALRDLTFTPAENFSPPEDVDDTVFSLTLTDGDLSDSGNSFTLNVTSINDAPVITNGGNSSYALSAGDQADIFSQLTLADDDVDAEGGSEGGAPEGIFTATIDISRAGSGSEYGILSGPSFDTTSDTQYTLTGSRAVLVDAINTISYIAPSANDTFTVSLTVADPTPSEEDSNSIDIVITVTQPSPGISGLVSTQSITDKNVTPPFATALFNNFGSVDRRVIVTIGSNNGVEGSFDVLAGFSDDGNGVYTFVGSSVEATNAIRGLRFLPAPDRITGSSEAVAFSIEVETVTTNTSLDLIDPAVTLTVTPVNDAPSISSPNAEIRIDDDETTNPFAGVVLSDPDEAGAQTIFVTVTLVGEELISGAPRNGGGELTTSTTPILGFVKEAGTVFTYTFSGTPSEVNTLLQALVFTPNPDRNPEGERETVNFTILVEDTLNGSGLSAQNQGTTVIVLSVNGAPVIGKIPDLADQPFPVAGSQDAGGIFTATPFEKLELSDDDGGDLTFTITLDNKDKGTLIDSGSDFASTDSGLTYTMTGTETDIQAALQGLVYTLDKSFVFAPDPVGTITFTLVATDSSAGNITTEVFSVFIRERNVAYIVSTTADSGAGSLREAVGLAANNDFIVFEFQPDEYPATIFLQSALTVSKNITVVGSGVAELTISGDSDDDGVGDVPLFIVTDGADLTLEHLTLKHGKAPSYGGAVTAEDGSRIVARFCSFEENTAGQFGGAIDLLNGELLVESCLFLNNNVNESTAFSGGAISVVTTQASVIRNSTFVGNAQLNGGGLGGGAIYAENSEASQSFDLLVEHCTFKDNTDAANNGTSILASTAGLEVIVRNNIFGDTSGSVLDVVGNARIDSMGGNVATGDPTTIYTDDPRDISILDDADDLVNTDALLLPLADNGGETLTCALDGGSLALDSAVLAPVLAEQPAVDQRGAWRDATPDAGAFESGTFKRFLINELFVTVDTEDQFIEFYNPRDSEDLTLNGLEVFVDGASAGVLSGLSATLLPGAGEAWPPAAGLSLDREKGTIELRNTDDQVVLLLNYIASFVDTSGDVDTLGQSITRYPRYEGGLLPHERVYELLTGGTTGLLSSSRDLDADGAPLDGGNAPPIAVPDLDENGDAIYNLLATETLDIDALANDVEFDRTDTIKITELMEMDGDLATVIASEFAQIFATSLELAAVTAPGDIFFPITPVADDTVFTFDPVGVDISINPDGLGIFYDPTASPTVIALSQGETITDYWAYTIRDFDATDTPQSRGTTTTFQENNIKRATSYFKIIITGVNEAPDAADDDFADDSNLATTENRALRILADADLLAVVPEFDFIDQEVDFQEFNSMGVQGPFLPEYPKVALLDNDDDVDNDDTNQTIRIISVNTTSDPSDLLTTTSELGASVVLDLRSDRIETNILYDPRASTEILNKLSEGETVIDSFWYTVQDVHGARDIAKVSIQVTGVNDVPTATDDPGFTANEDGTLEITATVLTANDSDPDQDGSGVDDMPEISQPILPANSVEGATLNFDGNTIIYDPRTIPAYESLARNETLEDSFTYTLDDGQGGTDVATVSITVEGRNDAPTAVDDSRAVTENDTATVSTPGLLVNDNDVDVNGSIPDDDAWIIPQRGVVSPLGASVNINSDGSYRYDANSVAIDALIEGEMATETFPYIITDNSRTSASDDTLRVLSGLVEVDLPILFNDSVVGSSPIGIAGYSEDLSDPSVLVVESVNHSLRNGLLVKIAGYQGSGDYNGVYPITSVDRDHFSVVVPFADDPAATRGTWKPWFAISNVTALDNGGTVAVVDGQTVLYTALAGFSGEESFEYTIEDGVGGQDVASVVIEVVDPTQNKLLVASADRFRVGKGTEDVQVNVLLNDVTLPGSIGALTILNAVAKGGATGTVEITNGNTALSYTPPTDIFVGDETFSYTISAGGVAISEADVTFVVEDRMIDNTGDPLLGQLSGNDDRFVVVSESSGSVLDVLANDSNLPSFPVASTLLSVTAPSGTVNIVGDTLVYDAPTGIGSGLDTFDYTSVDASGATTTQTVTILIVEEAPSFFAQADNYTVVAGSDMVLLPVLVNDTTVQDDSAVIRIEKLGLDGDAPPNVNRVAISGSQNFIEYTPPLAVPALGQEDFNYEIGIGGIELEEAKITITIVESLPVQTKAEDDFFTVARDSGPHILDVVNNDLPYPLAGWAWTIFSAGTGVGTTSDGGVVTVDGDSTVSYQPAAGFFGTETFTYEIRDVFGVPSTATVTVKVGELITAPDAFVVLEDSVDNPLDVLANDDILNRYAADYTIVLPFSAPSLGGTVTIDGSGPNNQLLYAPAAGITGDETFDYTVVDNTGAMTTETVVVSIIGLVSDRAFAELEVKITGINDIPMLSGTANGAITDKETIKPFNNVLANVSITDLDEFGLQSQSVSVTFASAYGTISAPGMTMNSAGNYSIIGTPAVVTAALKAIVFTPTENVIDYISPGFFDLEFTLSINDYDVGTMSAVPGVFLAPGVSDGPDAAVEDVTTIRITPINDAPTLVSPLSDLFLKVNALPRAQQLAPHFADVDDVVANPGGQITWTVVGNTAPSLFDSVTIDATKQLVVINLATDQFGVSDITIRATDRGLMNVETTFTVTVDGPPVIELEPGETQPPAATRVSGPNAQLVWFYRQSFRVTNEGVLPAEAFILNVTNLVAPVLSLTLDSGQLSTDENGTPENFSDDTLSSSGVSVLFQQPTEYTVKYDRPLAPDESVVVHLTYRFISLLDPGTIRPDIEVELTTATPMGAIGTGIIAIPDPSTGEVELTFAIEAGKSYLIEYSADMVNWDAWAISTPVSEFDREISIIDDGLYTDPHPSAAPMRFYRLVEIVVP